VLSEFPARNNDEPLQPVHAAHSEHPSRRAHHPDAFRIPEHVRGGVQWDLVAPGTVTFVLFAPYKPYVSLVGDFNEWDARAHRMVTDGQGLWWITLPHPGATRYGYYVAIDDTSHAWVGDPYAAEVRWEDGTPWAYLPEARSAFPWTDGEWKTPALRDLVIYELCVRDFAGEWAGTHQVYGNFARLLDHLDYLVDTGVNAVELMPIQAFPGNSSWGYNPVLYFAPAQVYGSPEQFKTFVDACHARGIAVILDVAFNHAWGEHPYYQIYPPMYGSHGEWLTDWNPFFHHTPDAVNMWGGVDWDHFAPETTRYFQDVVRYWLQEYHVDGFRFDWVCGVDYDSRDSMRPGFHPLHGISAVAWAARSVRPDCVLIGEFWQLDGTHPDKTAAKLVAETPVDACWNGDFHHTLDEMLNQRWGWEKRDIWRALGGFRELGYGQADEVINFSCSHDEVRPEHEIKYYSAGNIPRPAGMSINEVALRKALLGLVALFAAPGVPMIYAGQEFGEDAPRTIDFCPLNWDKLKLEAHRQHRAVVRRLIVARRQVAALRSDNIYFEVDDFERHQVVRWRRWDDHGAVALAALNFGHHLRTVTLDLPGGGAWRDVVSNRVYYLSGGPNQFVLQAWQAVLLVSVAR
jgi:1,4-alpha-glucan branching enzyme